LKFSGLIFEKKISKAYETFYDGGSEWTISPTKNFTTTSIPETEYD
jgi:hypothetical protein